MNNNIAIKTENIVTAEKANVFFGGLAVLSECCGFACCCKNKGGAFLVC